jgi:dipeptidyl-peptidase-4
MGATGWSYGGFMTLMLLTDERSGLAAATSGAPPTEWGLYDTHYTERFMGTPEENVQGYADSDVVARLDRLSGRLLLIHGMADDNVIFANTTRVLEALQVRGVPFDTMLYPGQRHGIRGNERGLHLWRTYLEFFDRNIGEGRR